MNPKTIDDIKMIYKQHIKKIYPPEQKDYCSYKFIDKKRQEFCFDTYNDDEFIKFYMNHKYYALIEMKTRNYHFFVDFDIFYKHNDEIHDIKYDLHKKLNETLYAIYQKSYESIWSERMYYSEPKKSLKLGIHVYIPGLIVNNLYARVIRHAFCGYNQKYMKIMDPSVYTIYTGLYYQYSVRKNGEYQLQKYYGNYNFQIRTHNQKLTDMNPISKQYIEHLLNIFTNDTSSTY